MNDDDDVKAPQTKPDDPSADAEAVETLTPSSTRAKELAVEKQQKKVAEIERHVADGN